MRRYKRTDDAAHTAALQDAYQAGLSWAKGIKPGTPLFPLRGTASAQEAAHRYGRDTFLSVAFLEGVYWVFGNRGRTRQCREA